MTTSFAFDKAKELLVNKLVSEQKLWLLCLLKNIFLLYIELFDSICDERDLPELHKSIDTLERILIDHFSNKKTRLGGWEEEDE